jgi:hypothetical protein
LNPAEVAELLIARAIAHVSLYQHKHFVQNILDLEAGEQHLSFAFTLIM